MNCQIHHQREKFYLKAVWGKSGNYRKERHGLNLQRKFFLFLEMSKIEMGCLRRESSKNMEVLQNLYGTAWDYCWNLPASDTLLMRAETLFKAVYPMSRAESGIELVSVGGLLREWMNGPDKTMDKITSRVISSSNIQWFLQTHGSVLCPSFILRPRVTPNQEAWGWHWEARAGLGMDRRVTQEPRGWKPALQRASKSLPATEIPLGHSNYPGPGPGGRRRLACPGPGLPLTHLVCAAYKGGGARVGVGHWVVQVHEASFSHLLGSGTHRRKGIGSQV